jgi:hypothetical protein
LVEATCFIFVCSCFLELRSTELLMPLSQLVEAKVLCYIVQSQPWVITRFVYRFSMMSHLILILAFDLSCGE